MNRMRAPTEIGSTQILDAAGWPEQNAVCRHCGYSLWKLPGFRCPECGKEFDPRNPATFRIRHDQSPPERLIGVAARSTSLVMALVCRVWRAARSYDGQRVTLALLALPLGILWQLKSAAMLLTLPVALATIIVIYASLVQSLRGRDTWRRGRIVAFIAVSLALASNIGWDECPHAKYVWIGPIEIAIRGRACGNVRYPNTLFERITGISFWRYGC